MTPPTLLFVAGELVAGSTPADDPALPFALDGLTVTWGRPTTLDQPAASTCDFVIQSTTGDAGDLFDGRFALGSSVLLAAGAEVPVFTGQITDVSMVASDDDPDDVLLLRVTADDVLADLANRPAGAARPTEPFRERVRALLDAARTSTGFDVAAGLAAVPINRILADDVADAMVGDLLSDMALSVDGVLWSQAAAGGDPFLYVEDPSARSPLRRLALVPPWVVIVDAGAVAGALEVDACLIDLAPLEWRQTMSDLVTGVSASWVIPDPDDPVLSDIEQSVNVFDPAVESPAAPFGVRRMTIATQLTTQAGALDTASKILARMSTASWRLGNVMVSDAELGDADMVRLLDCRTRGGLPVMVTGLPAWCPPTGDTFAGYVEGGDITITAGRWSTSLWLSLSQGYAGKSARWIDLPDDPVDWQWQDFDPGMSWADLTGVGGPV